MQAALLYGILCSKCPEIIYHEDVAWVVEMIEAFGHKLYSDIEWNVEATEKIQNRRQWAVVESMRR
jgi:hypothetical protein